MRAYYQYFITYFDINQADYMTNSAFVLKRFLNEKNNERITSIKKSRQAVLDTAWRDWCLIVVK